jgi:hypothetical protein
MVGAEDEIEAAIAAGKQVCYVAADMNHAVALGKARRKAEGAKDFKGPIHRMFSRC